MSGSCCHRHTEGSHSRCRSYDCRSAARRDDSASLSYGGTEHLIDEYEVLCGSSDSTVLKWMNFRHGERAEVHGWMPVEGGREKDGQALFIAKGEYDK